MVCNHGKILCGICQDHNIETTKRILGILHVAAYSDTTRDHAETVLKDYTYIPETIDYMIEQGLLTSNFRVTREGQRHLRYDN